MILGRDNLRFDAFSFFCARERCEYMWWFGGKGKNELWWGIVVMARRWGSFDGKEWTMKFFGCKKDF